MVRLMIKEMGECSTTEGFRGYTSANIAVAAEQSVGREALSWRDNVGTSQSSIGARLRRIGSGLTSVLAPGTIQP